MFPRYLFFFIAITTFNCWPAQQNDLEAPPVTNQEQIQKRQNCDYTRLLRDAAGGLSFLMGAIQVLEANAFAESDPKAMDIVGRYAVGLLSITLGALGTYIVNYTQTSRSNIPLNITRDQLQQFLREHEVTEDLGRIFQGMSVNSGSFAISGLLPALSFIPAAKFLVTKVPKAPIVMNIFAGSASMAVPICCWTRDFKNWITRGCCSRQAQAQET